MKYFDEIMYFILLSTAIRSISLASNVFESVIMNWVDDGTEGEIDASNLEELAEPPLHVFLSKLITYGIRRQMNCFF